MRLPFALRHAARESRSSVRRLGVYMGTITLGVAALVAINGYRSNAIRSLDLEARALLGADLRLSSGRPFPDSIDAVLDSAAAAGVPVSRVTSTVTMALSRRGFTRLVQLRAIDGGYPYYGEVETVPAGEWGQLGDGGVALVEPAVLQALGVAPGDSVRIGERWLRVAASTPSLPPELSFRSAIGPRVFIDGDDLASTGLVGFGSLVRYEAFLALPERGALRGFIRDRRELFRGSGLSVETATEQAEDIARGLDTFGRFLGLVGLVALLLGGLGVASAVHVFVADKRATVAVLRCIGATQRTTFSAYLVQAALLGLAGALAGVLLGIGVQALLPRLLAGAVPFRTTFSIDFAGILAGLATGVWVATAFALLPLLEIRQVTPLAALRHEVEGHTAKRRDPMRTLVLVAIMASVVALAIWQAPELDQGVGFAAGIGATLLVLWAAARLAIALTRRLRPRRAAFTVRHGVASLFRPHNQTVAVTIALGFGVFLVVALWVVQHALIRSFVADHPDAQPNLVAFDIQPDQRADVVASLERAGATYLNVVPIVTARIAALNGVPADSILANRRAHDVEGWALRREYRNTFRDSLTASETLVAGEWWGGSGAADPASDGPSATPPANVDARSAGAAAGGERPAGDAPADGSAALPRISVEQDVAGDLGLGLGDRVTWDVQGVRVETRVASLRTVEWARFDTNFFVVFEPGVLEQAPQTLVAVANVPDAAARTAVQRDIVMRSPNISLIDVGTVQATLDRIIGQVTLAIRFMALFSVAAGVMVLIGAISASRFQRMRESVLLRTLGATRAQVRRIMLVEYALLGAMAAGVGCVLGTLAGWALLTRVFELPFRPPIATIALAGLSIIALAVLIGLLNGREALRQTPLAALREADA